MCDIQSQRSHLNFLLLQDFQTIAKGIFMAVSQAQAGAGYSLSQAAEITGISARSLARYAAAGRIHGACKLSGAWILPPGSRFMAPAYHRSMSGGSFTGSWIGCKEAAILTGWSARRVQQLCKQGIIPAQKLGGVWAIPVITEPGTGRKAIKWV